MERGRDHLVRATVRVTVRVRFRHVMERGRVTWLGLGLG